MKFSNKKTLFFYVAVAAFTILSCEKLLNERSDKSLVVPSTLVDFQALMDKDEKSIRNYPQSGEESTDDYYLTDADYQALRANWDQRRYIWTEDDIFEGAGSLTQSGQNPWYWGYLAIYTSNSILHFLPNAKESNTEAGRNVKGQALFWRAFRYYEMAQVWTLPYDARTADTDLGLPLRLDTDFNTPSVRSTLSETYQQIFNDLVESIPLLTTNPIHVVRASRQGAYGLLARAYLSIRDYERAGAYADSCLQIHSLLLDFNELNNSAAYPIKVYNEETITYAQSNGILVNPNIAKINPQVYALYDDADLRKSIFFTKNPDESLRFRGGLSGSVATFHGISTGEMFLIRAECYARKGEVQKAMDDLNTLLKSRWDRNIPFEPYMATNTEEARRLVLEERRKELLMRGGLRWMDIRRLNLEGANITQTRTVLGQTYTLPPNDPRYALALPEDLLERSGMPQNRR